MCRSFSLFLRKREVETHAGRSACLYREKDTSFFLSFFLSSREKRRLVCLFLHVFLSLSQKRTTAPSSSRRRSGKLNSTSKARQQTPSKAFLVKSLKAARGEGKKKASLSRSGTTPSPVERGGVFSNETNNLSSSSPLPVTSFSSSKAKRVAEDFDQDELLLSSSSTSPSSPAPSSSSPQSSSSSSSRLALPLIGSETSLRHPRKTTESRRPTNNSGKSFHETSCNSNEVAVGVGIDSSSMEVDPEEEEGKNVMEEEEEEEEREHERQGEKTGLFTWLWKLWRK